MSSRMPLSRLRSWAVLSSALVASAWFTSGCATYSQKALAVREPLIRGDFVGAETFLVEEKPGGDGLPYLFELGLVQRYAEQFDASNETFDQAELLIEDLWTKSVSKELLAFATSDETIAYDGEIWERVLVNYYRALNYIDLGRYEDALVECRKLNERLRVFASSTDDPPTYETDAFALWMTGMLYEAGGDVSDAWVSLRLADEAYGRWKESYGVPTPVALERDLLRLATAQGFRNEADEYRARFTEGEGARWSADDPDLDPSGRGEIVLFWEEGFIPAKVQAEATIPILEDEWGDHWIDLAPTLANRYHHPVHYRKSTLEYLLRFALPAYPPPAPNPHRSHARVTLDGEHAVTTELASDLEAIARHGLEDRSGHILLRTIARGLAKYAMTRAARKENEVVGVLTNLLTAATEKADTRSWITLPRTIQVARLVVPPGTHDLEMVCYGPDGHEKERVAFAGVTVGANEVRFLSHRTFE
ncbi:MAG: hypothetical protein R3B81_08255 [bacterium]